MGGISIFMVLGILMSVAILFLVALLIFMVYLIMNYVLESIFLYHISKKLNYQYPILSWLPFYNKYYLGKVGKKELQAKVLLMNYFILVVLLSISSMVSSLPTGVNTLIFIFTLLSSLLNFVLNIWISHHIMKVAIPKIATYLTLLNVFTLGLSRSIILFVIRNNENLIA